MGPDCEFADDMERLKYEIVDAENGYKVLYDNDFWAVRRGSRGLNTLSPKEGINVGDWFNLRVRGMQDKTAISEKNNWVNSAIHQKNG